MRYSNGNTLPLVSLPYALASFSVQTDGARGGWFYSPRSRSFEGIRLTHRPSPWIGDFSYFTFMPQSEKPFVSEDARWSGFRPQDTVLRPDYLRLRLLRYGAEISLAPTDSGAVMRLNFDSGVKVPRFAVTPDDFDGEIVIDEAKREIYGYTTSHNGKPERKFPVYFVFAFDCDISDACVSDGKNAFRGFHYKGRGAGANVALGSHRCEVKLAISYIDTEQARFNLTKEASCDFEHTRSAAENIWEDALSSVLVTGSKEKMQTFYSCLYRAFLYPTKFYETSSDGKFVHVVPESGEARPGIMYTNNGFWDTYRTVYPLFSLIAPDKCRQFAEAWLNFYDDTGYLPRWPSPCETDCMPGTLAEAVLADAIVKGLLSEEESRHALEAMLKNAGVQSDDAKRGRKCVADYARLGYVPYDKCRESVNETLDCAYGDYCIAQTADFLGENGIAEKYYKRSKNYRNLFDSSVGFMRAKDSSGRFADKFDCFDWGEDYTEASAWQTTLAVQHDIDGLAGLFGGADGLDKYVDRLIAAPPRYNVNGYGHEIHEMTEMATVDFGQCALSNQPSFHIPYVYAAIGKKEKSVSLVRALADKLFSPADDGYPGDEDNGTMACWYIFASMGFYPFCPGKAEYIVTEPLFESVMLRTDGGYVNLNNLLKGKTVIKHSEFFRIG